MDGSTSMEGPSEAELGPSNRPPGFGNPYIPFYATAPYLLPPTPAAPYTPPPSSNSSPDPVCVPGPKPEPKTISRRKILITCRYCHKRKIRCSGRGIMAGDKCVNCSRMNQECILFDSIPAAANAPSVTAPGIVTLAEGAFGPLRQAAVQEPYQDRVIGGLEHGIHPISHEQYSSQCFTFAPPAPIHHGSSYHNQHLSYRQIHYDADAHEHYPVPGTPQGVHINSELKGNDCDVLDTWNHQRANPPHNSTLGALQNPFEIVNGTGRQLRHSSIRESPHIQSFEPQSLGKTDGILKEYDWNVRGVSQSVDLDLRTKSIKQPQVLKEPIELLDATGLNLRSRTPSPSPTPSSDIEVISMSEHSDGGGEISAHSHGYRIFSRVLRRIAILSQNEVTARGESSSSSPKGKQVAKGGSTSSSSSRDGTSTTRGRKKQRQHDNSGDEGGNEKNEPPSKRGKTSQSECMGRSRFLACPYWKSDPERYWDCFLKKNDTVSHLKQHLTRRHTPKYYCQICYETFKDFELFDSHALARSCTRGPFAKLDGISQQQKNRLSLKSKGTIEEQWYTVWSILFPDMDPPATIYIHSTQSEDFCRIQEFAQREGVVIMLDELESNGLVVRPGASSQLLQSTVRRAMVSIFRSYSMRRQPDSEEAEEPIPSHAFGTGQGITPEQELTTECHIGRVDLPATSTQVEPTMKDGTDNSSMERSESPNRSSWSQLPITAPWLSRGSVQDHNEDDSLRPAFLNDQVFGESSSGNDLPFNLEGSDMLDLDALLRDVISTEA